ncbi:folate family ECF transporter S component [Christensenellaceae bacterium OttesenSCG-928-L17]|nr:folate family ECF transporter S component [Christensenellaceae bacterium OttesenSCG-928-L17]
MQTNKMIRRLVLCGLFTALGVVLGGMLSVPAFVLGGYSVKIGLGVLPVLLSAVLYGPVYGGIVGALVDFLQAILFPKGAYMPWFTIVGALFGVVPGLFFLKKQAPTLRRLFSAVATGQLFCSVLCNTLLVSWLYGMPLLELMGVRLVNQAVMIPLYTLLLYLLFRSIPALRRELPALQERPRETVHPPEE